MDLNGALVTVLKNLSARVDEDDQEIIRATLEDVSGLLSMNRSRAQLSFRPKTT